MTTAGSDIAAGAAPIPLNADFFDAVLRAIPGVVCVYDLARQETCFVSRELSALLGYPSRATGVQEPIVDPALIHVDDRATLRLAIDGLQQLPSHGQAEITVRVRRVDGAWRWLHLRGSRFAFADLDPARCIVAVADDVTEQREAELALARSAESLRLAQELANVGSYDRDLVTGHVRWSEQMFRIHGADPIRDEPNSLGDLIERFVHHDDRAALRRAMRELATTGRAGPYAYRVVRSDGTVRHVVGQGAILRDVAGRAVRRVGSVIDVTERVAAEEERVRLEVQVREAQKLESLGVLAGGIAHDFNNLLVGILGNASVSLLDLSPASPTYTAVTAIERAARDAAALTRQLLAYAGKGRYVLEPLDLSWLVEQLQPMLRTALGPRAQIALEVSRPLPVVMGDAEQVRQALVNLVTNAAEAIGDKDGRVEVSTRIIMLDNIRLRYMLSSSRAVPGRHVCITVRDNGPGMDAATQSRIFDPFFSTRFTGRGLGLAATLGIVHGHGGAIEVESAPGRGTALHLFFPESTAEKTTLQDSGEYATPSSAKRLSRARVRVLVVDDDPHVRGLAERLLVRLGYEVVTVNDGVDALDFIRADPTGVDCVLLDMTMPRMNGEDTMRGARAIAPWMPVILMSGYSEHDVTGRLTEHGLNGFLQKPFTVETVTEMFMRVVGPPELPAR